MKHCGDQTGPYDSIVSPNKSQKTAWKTAKWYANSFLQVISLASPSIWGQAPRHMESTRHLRHSGLSHHGFMHFEQSASSIFSIRPM